MSAEPNGRAERFATDAERWLLLDGNRLAVAGVVLVATFAVLAAVAWSNWFPLRSPSSLYYAFSTLAGGNLTLVTVVVSINQLVVSRQLMSAGEVRKRMQEAIEFRDQVEQLVDDPIAPVEPDAFLDTLVRGARRELDRLRDARDATGDLSDDLDRLVVPLGQHFDYVSVLLERTGTDVFTALSTVLDTDYANELQQCQHLLVEYDLDDDTEECVNRLIDTLEHLNVARQFFKTIYMQEELSFLSRVLVYVGVPAILGSLLALFVTGNQTGSSIPWWMADVLVPVGVTVGLAPLAVLVSVVVRVATVTQLTAAPTPFIQIE